MAGYFLGRQWQLERRLRDLSTSVRALQRELAAANEKPKPSVLVRDVSPPPTAPKPAPVREASPRPARASVRSPAGPVDSGRDDSAFDPPASVANSPTPWSDELAAAARRWLTTGNVPVKIGVIVLFFGVAFLLKYAVDRGIAEVPD